MLVGQLCKRYVGGVLTCNLPLQNVMLLQVQRERDEHLRQIQSQLLLFESQLRRRQKEVEALIKQKDSSLRQQQHVIVSLSRALSNSIKARQASEASRKAAEDEAAKDEAAEDGRGKGERTSSSLLFTSTKSDPESLNDSDSAIMLEDNLDSLVLIPLGKGEVKVVRSVSDAVEVANRSSCGAAPAPDALAPPATGGAASSSLLKPGYSGGAGPGSLSTSPSCSSEESDDSPSCTLTKGRAELLRTVYSLDEEEVCHAHAERASLLGAASSAAPPLAPSLHSILKSSSHYDSDATLSDGESDDADDDDDDDEGLRQLDDSCSDRRQLLGSYEKLNSIAATSPAKPRPDEEIQVTYNRVMSNHRSVTKPKDVKYRRINKAKSRSLEELRGKLKYWTDRGGKQSLSVDLDTQSFA